MEKFSRFLPPLRIRTRETASSSPHFGLSLSLSFGSLTWPPTKRRKTGRNNTREENWGRRAASRLTKVEREREGGKEGGRECQKHKQILEDPTARPGFLTTAEAIEPSGRKVLSRQFLRGKLLILLVCTEEATESWDLTSCGMWSPKTGPEVLVHLVLWLLQKG